MANEQRNAAPQIIVVGGGLAGLTAACRLAVGTIGQPRPIVTVLEAAARVGGRTASMAVPSAAARGCTAHIDIGGQWIGERQTAARALATRLGVRLWPQFCAGRRTLQIGARVSTYSGLIPSLSVGQLLDTQLMLTLLGVCQLLLRVAPARFGAWADRTTMADLMARFMWTAGGAALVAILVQALFGTEPGGVSLLAFMRYVRANGGDVEAMAEMGPGTLQAFTCVGGSQQMSLALARELAAAGGRVVFGCRAARVDMVHRTGTVAEGGAPLRPVRVTCANGEVFDAEHVILAMPPALAADITFQPPLPRHRDLLMRDSAMGCIIKCIAVYETPFWREAGFSGEVIADTSDEQVGPVFNAFDNCVPVTAVAAAPAGAPPSVAPPPVHDGERIMPALVGFINGARAREWASADPEARQAAVLRQFGRWFGPRALAPLEFVEKNWVTDEFTRGCPIATYGRGVLGQFGLRRALREACGQETYTWTASAGGQKGGAKLAAAVLHRIHWAGTETADEGTGFMDGAIRSGEAAADEVAADIACERRLLHDGFAPTEQAGAAGWRLSLAAGSAADGCVDRLPVPPSEGGVALLEREAV
jgi:monoamine oxidase